MAQFNPPRSANYTRVHESAVGPWEKPLLRAMAARMPAFVMPDHLTILGLVGSAITGACYAATDWSPVFLIGASIGLFINWVGDSLDGTLARYRGTERPRYGFFIDHTSDIFSQMLIAFGLGLSAYMRFDIACMILIAYLTVSVFTYIRMQASKVLQVSYGGFGPTELRLIMLAGNVAAYLIGPQEFAVPGIGMISPFDVLALLLFAGAVTSVLIGAITIGKQIALEDQPAEHARISAAPGE
jgi:archaetidylinositol phosphate synthase